MVGMNVHNRPYQPINSYGVIGDCHSVVLASPDGSIDWGCLPDFDSPAIFCRLLDAERGGYFQIAPTDGTIPGSQRYLHNSNVLQTRFASMQGEIVTTDFMPVETLSAWPYRGMNNNTWTHEDGSCHSLVRIVECTHGEVDVTMTLKVTPNFAASPSEITLVPGNRGALVSGEQHVVLAIIGAQLCPEFSVSVTQDPETPHQSVVAQFTLCEGERVSFVLGMGRSVAAARRLLEKELFQRNYEIELAQTLRNWRSWVANCTYHGPYQGWVQRSALALKMMTYAPTGAIVAAPTTSLPEEFGGERNWDYRFTWLRDATFTLYAFNVLGFTEEARAFTHWLRRLSYANGEDLQIMYGIRGERDIPERYLTHLSGYCDSKPIRIGNEAARQRQMDVFGEVLDCIHMYRRQGCFERYGESLEGPLWDMMRDLVDHVCAHWHEPDCGIWEVRA
ncbi:MAG TPA: glycoside hydrolase family 15 protein, partial [Ktedonobacteraceae bacterium]